MKYDAIFIRFAFAFLSLSISSENSTLLSFFLYLWMTFGICFTFSTIERFNTEKGVREGGKRKEKDINLQRLNIS